MAITYYALVPLTIAGNDYVAGDDIPTADLGTAVPRLIRRGLIAADGGLEGDAGPTGPAGPSFADQFTGVWDDATQYASGKLVHHEGHLYLANTLAHAADEPGANPAWTLVV